MGSVEIALKKLRDNHEVADFILVAETGKEFPVHKVVLFMHSDVLYRMSTAKDFTECQNGRAVLKEVRENSVSAMVDHFYDPNSVHLWRSYHGAFGDHYGIESHTRLLVDLRRLADMYNISILGEQVEEVFGDFFVRFCGIEHMGQVVDALAPLDAPSTFWQTVRLELENILSGGHSYKPADLVAMLKKHPSLAMDVLHDLVAYNYRPVG